MSDDPQDPKVFQPQIVNPQVVQPQVVEPQFVQPQVVQPQIIQPKIVEQKVAFFRPARIILWLIILVGASWAGFEVYARNSYKSSFEALSKRNGTIYKKDVEKYLYGWIKSRSGTAQWKEEIVWMGVVRSYSLTLNYTGRGRLVGIYTGDEIKEKKEDNKNLRRGKKMPLGAPSSTGKGPKGSDKPRGFGAKPGGSRK